MNRIEGDHEVCRDIEQTLPELKRIVADHRRMGIVSPSEWETLDDGIRLLELAAGRLLLRVHDAHAMDCEGVDLIEAAEAAWPNG